MNNSAFITLSSLCYTILLIVVYFYKKRVSIIENKIYIGIMITTITSIILFLITSMFAKLLVAHEAFNNLILRMYIASLGFWISAFTIYTYASCTKNDISKISKVKRYTISFSIVVLILTYLVFTLPMDYLKNTSGDYYIGGASVNIIYIYSLILIILNIYYLFKNIKNIGIKKFLPLITFIILGIITIYITLKVPGLLLITPLEAFITFLMYFTLENPDIMVIKEFDEASENMTKMMSEKDMFQYNVCQKTKYPLEEIQRLSTSAINLIEDNPKESEEIMKEIWSISNDLQITIDNTLNLDSIDKSKIKVYKTKYNIKLLIEIITKTYQKELANSPVKLVINTSPMLPTYLYGDSGALKEVINIVVNNSIKHTKEGYISIDTNYMVKDDICRLTVIVEDSGEGITINKLNKVYQGDADNENLTRAKKILEAIGGTLLINTKIGHGSKITIIVEQKLADENEGKLKEVAKTYLGALKVLVVDDDNKENDKIKKELSNYNINLETLNMGIDCLNKIRGGEIYDLIFIKENLPILNGLTIFEKLKKISTFNIDTYLIVDKKHDIDKLKKDGFIDILENTDELKKIIQDRLEKNNT